MTAQRGRRAGFTLVEVLVAMTVLLIGITGVAALFTHGLTVARSGDENAYAAQIGRSVRDALAVAMSAPLRSGTVYWVNFVHDGVGVGTSQMAAGAGNVGIPQYPFPLPRVRGEVRHHPGNQAVAVSVTGVNTTGPIDGSLPVYGPGGIEWVSPVSPGNPLGNEIFRLGATRAPTGAESNVWQNPIFSAIQDIRGAPVESPGSIGVIPMPTDLTLDYGLYRYDFLVEGDFAAVGPPALARVYLFTIRVFRGEYAAGDWQSSAAPPVTTLQFPLAAMD